MNSIKDVLHVSGQHGSLLLSDGAKPSPVAEEDIEEDTLRVVHKEKDFISLLSCTPGQLKFKLCDIWGH